jgi:hypothetical protein
VDPVDPVEPVVPVGPVGPVAPVGPVGPVGSDPPVPERATVAGLLGSLLLMFSVAVLAPGAWAANRTPISHVPLTATGSVQRLLMM